MVHGEDKCRALLSNHVFLDCRLHDSAIIQA